MASELYHAMYPSKLAGVESELLNLKQGWKYDFLSDTVPSNDESLVWGRYSQKNYVIATPNNMSESLH